MLFSSFTFHFSCTCLPSCPLAEMMSRFDFLPCCTVRVLSGIRVISFWKAFLFLGSALASLASSLAAFLASAALSASALSAGFFSFLVFFFSVFLAGAFLKRSLTFLRNGEWL